MKNGLKYSFVLFRKQYKNTINFKAFDKIELLIRLNLKIRQISGTWFITLRDIIMSKST